MSVLHLTVQATSNQYTVNLLHSSKVLDLAVSKTEPYLAHLSPSLYLQSLVFEDNLSS
jgi:hypothetical protein